MRAFKFGVLVCAALPVMSAAGVDGEGSRRPIDSSDLLRIVDIGVTSEHDGDGVAVSPDHSAVALEVRKVYPESNSVTVHWVIASLNRPHVVAEVGDGGSPISDFYLDSASGYSPAQRPQWSPDSEWIVYRADHGGDVQLWRSRRDGRTTEKLTSSKTAVKRFRWSRDGGRILFEASTGDDERLRIEGQRGYLYDERFAPVETLKPIDPAEATATLRVYELANGKERSATAEEIVEFEQLEASASLQSLVRRAAGVSTWLGDFRANKRIGINPPLTVVARSGEAEPVACPSPVCTARFFKGLWLADDGGTVYFLRWAGAHPRGALALYRWRRATGEVAEILRTDSLIEGCARSGRRLICAHESTTSPRRLVSVELDTGRFTTLFDPNSHFSRFIFGSVTSEYWHDRNGIQGFGHLVMPPGYRAGERVPLVVVQYRSRGFLRGGTGDEYPIHVLAAKGLAVLSFDRPDDPELEYSSGTPDEVEVRGWQGFRDRRRVLSVLEAGVDRLVETGTVDPNKIAITGLSDGGETLAFALIHSQRRFAAAIATWTYWNPILFPLAGPKFQPRLRDLGLDDPATEEGYRRWQDISIGLNAHRIQTPLLLQVSDSELLLETQTYTALKRANKAVEMYVFPGEGHIKAQPIHRLNVYRRNVQWLRFWLQGVEESNPLDPLQYARWRDLRERSDGTMRTRAQ